ncbi:hypothetical protein CCACVL1_17582 [Corchorus capsularis]|uniref:Uncharacterized protein n=1 Tax=Corchorus capsularis TaxID=210143 RepID=A0A1R3HR33_COCAP|nr:hypothetical protein CCACVL1_17582 [Corchorus capsularis]
MRGGCAAQQSLSVGNSRRHDRNHVDSLVLRGKQVARALLLDGTSCEVISCFPGKDIEQDPVVEESVGAVEKIVEVAANFAKEVDELYGDLGLSASNGVFKETVVGREHDKRQVNPHFRGGLVEAKHSAYSTTDNSFGSRELWNNPKLLRQLVAGSGACSHPSILGIGQSNWGLDRGGLGLDLIGLWLHCSSLSKLRDGQNQQAQPPQQRANAAHNNERIQLPPPRQVVWLDPMERLRQQELGGQAINENMRPRRAEVDEAPQDIIARFLAGLNREIHDIVEMQQHYDVEELLQHAFKAESQVKRNKKSFASSSSS